MPFIIIPWDEAQVIATTTLARPQLPSTMTLSACLFESPAFYASSKFFLAQASVQFQNALSLCV
jgi:hypothetical protein